ncbi:hypothetical protein chmu004 [Choristoneura murinana nucleopolyhedrovirus]|uniref:Uncharacterized protein n=1 Tax=Choristoneura murinana nucleopolyhedrovirus TaxID=1987479 RepID=V9XTM5_9ABAC|nr:hypothetical protein chmu004 [Choristoneura murinana nucleopolyhedrovirus]AHD25491.1 hypothetical protein chmu004 [Choristoneura murinana nucleopolyhedrovirus]BBU37482.1 hypothetical protein [Choristoneura diversana nucleopolyhedrovirus]
MADVNKDVIFENNHCFIVLHPDITTPTSDDPDECLNIQTQSQLVLNSATSDAHDDQPPELPPTRSTIQI